MCIYKCICSNTENSHYDLISPLLYVKCRIGYLSPFSLILMRFLQGSYKEIEAWRHDWTCPRSYSKWQKQDVNSIQEDEIKFFAFSVLSISFWKFNVWTPALDMKWDFKASFLYFQYYRTLKHFWKVCYWAEWNNDVSKIDTAKSKVWEALSVKRQVSEAAHIETNS
jgi:hypothetical protein